MTACRERYGSAGDFLKTFNPSMQRAYCRDLERVFMGAAPSVTTLAQAYGRQVAESWLALQLRDLSEFSGCRDKLTLAQLGELSAVIAQTFGHFKVTELMYFLQLFKAGRWGKFYGAVDGLAITAALHSFARERMETIHRYRIADERAARQAEEEQHRRDLAAFHARLDAEGITLQEWLRNQRNAKQARHGHEIAADDKLPTNKTKTLQRG